MAPKRLLALIAVIGCSSTVIADGRIEMPLSSIFYWGTEINAFDTGTAGDANAAARIISIEWTGLELETYNNVGLPNYGNEAMLGLEATNAAGELEQHWWIPFPDANYQGTADNPIQQPEGENFIVNLEEHGLELDVLGKIRGLVMNAWWDGSDDPAGQWIGGTVTIHYEKVPAPGALALLGLAGLACRRRRRR